MKLHPVEIGSMVCAWCYRTQLSYREEDPHGDVYVCGGCRGTSLHLARPAEDAMSPTEADTSICGLQKLDFPPGIWTMDYVFHPCSHAEVGIKGKLP